MLNLGGQMGFTEFKCIKCFSLQHSPDHPLFPSVTSIYLVFFSYIPAQHFIIFNREVKHECQIQSTRNIGFSPFLIEGLKKDITYMTDYFCSNITWPLRLSKLVI